MGREFLGLQSRIKSLGQALDFILNRALLEVFNSVFEEVCASAHKIFILEGRMGPLL